MPATPTLSYNTAPGYGAVNRGSAQTAGPVITDDTNSPASVAVTLNGAQYGGPVSVNIYDNGTLRQSQSYDATAASNVPYIVYQLLLPGPGVHTVTSVSSTTADGVLPSSPALNIFQLPAPVAGVVTTNNTSIDFARLFGAGYTIGFVNPASTIRLVDGVIGYGNGTPEAALQRLYQGLLNRAYDGAGLSYQDSLLSSGTSLSTVASQFVSSPEYLALHGIQTDAQFVSGLYQGFLGRAPDAGGNGYFLGLLGSGTSRGAVAAVFATSPEATARLSTPDEHVFARDAAGTLVNLVYQGGLNRTVDASGLATFKGLLGSGASPASFAAAIAGSAEFAALHGAQSNQDYVTSLYQSALGRAPDVGGLQANVQGLGSGAVSRADVLLSVANSAEANMRLPATL